MTQSIDFRKANIIAYDRLEWNNGDLKAINPTYKLESGAILNERQFKKLGALLNPQGIFFVIIYPSLEDK